MASITIAIDPEVLEAAKLEAEHRQISLDQLVAESLAAIAHAGRSEEDNRKLLELMERGPLGDLGKLPTREDIYTERTWPRS